MGVRFPPGAPRYGPGRLENASVVPVVVVAQSVRASGCDSEGRRFDPGQPPQVRKAVSADGRGCPFFVQAPAHMLCHNDGTTDSDNGRIKRCPRCEETKPLDAFYKKSDRLAGAYCKPCQLEYVREHYRRTKGAYNARSCARRWRNAKYGAQIVTVERPRLSATRIAPSHGNTLGRLRRVMLRSR
jgi:hypothetical protein